MNDDGIYSPAVMALRRRPAHRRALPAPDLQGTAENRLCGDHITVSVRLAPDGSVAEAAYEANCCAIASAAAEAMAELAPGRDAAGLRALAEGFETMLRGGGECGTPTLRAFLPLCDYPARIGCAILAWRALSNALPRNAP